jgi:ABC-type lipoprotein release transport system permease subunit
MYDTPGHAIASGLFIGTAGTVLCWVIGFILKVYATWIWRAVIGVARGLEPVPLDRMLMQD